MKKRTGKDMEGDFDIREMARRKGGSLKWTDDRNCKRTFGRQGSHHGVHRPIGRKELKKFENEFANSG